MCGTCGCASKTKTTLVNLQTGTETTLKSEVRGDLHEHVHADGTRHSQAHDDHAHEHVHADGTRHSHGHDDHSHGHMHADVTQHSHAQEDHAHARVHADGTRHSHPHGPSADHAHELHAHGRSHHVHPTGEVIELEARILAKNETLAAKNRAWFAGREILALNLVSSPGAGKTTLLERTIRDLKHELKLYVIEGDQATASDGERIRAAGAPAVQVNTGTGCHLEADMVARGVSELRPEAGAVLMIENVGNLVCPALFDLGERAKLVILSVTEGEDKPLKYPHMFRAAEVMILNKTDLLPYVDFDVTCCIANARQVNPRIHVIQVSARNGDGLPDWYGWLRAEIAATREEAFGGT